jgi:hypothetical protein
LPAVAKIEEKKKEELKEEYKEKPSIIFKGRRRSAGNSTTTP